MLRKPFMIFAVLLISALLLTACAGDTREGDLPAFLDPDAKPTEESLSQADGDGWRLDNSGDADNPGADNNDADNNDGNPGFPATGGDDEDNNAAGLPGTGSDEENDDERDRDKDLFDENEFEDDLERRTLYRLENLVGETIETESGEDIGTVDSVLVQPESGVVRYLVVEVEDDLDLDGDYVLIPWAAVAGDKWKGDETGNNRYNNPGRDGNPGRGNNQGIPPGHLPPPSERQPMDCSELPPGHLPPPELRDELCLDNDDDEDEDNGIDFERNGDDDDEDAEDENNLVFRYDEDVIANGPSFSNEDLDRLDEGGWEKDLDGYWRSEAGVEGLPGTGNNAGNRGYVRLAGDEFDLVDEDGDSVGDVTMLLLHLPSSKVKYAVFDTGGLFDTEERYGVIPFSQLDWSEDEDAFRLPFDEADVDRLPRFDDEGNRADDK